MGEEKKPGSLRTRIERKRKTYEQKVNWRAVLVALNRDLLELEERGAKADPEVVNSTFRAIHTVKGLSGMLGLASINELSHSMEDALSTVRQGEATVGGGLAEALFESLDCLSEMVEATARGDTGGRDVGRAPPA